MAPIPETMRAVVAQGGGGPEVLQVVERPVPAPRKRRDPRQGRGGGGQPAGRPPAARPLPAASRRAGRPRARNCRRGRRPGRGSVTLFRGRQGDGSRRRAAAMRNTPRSTRRNALPVPAPLSLEEAGAIPETFFTVWTNVFERGALKAGETLLVHGGTSGIGTTAIQLAKAFGAIVIATAGGAEKCDACRKLGAELAINYRETDFVAAVQGLHRRQRRRRHPRHGRRQLHLAQLRRRGAGMAASCRSPSSKAAVAEVDFRRLMLKRLTHTGSTLRPRPVEEKAEIARALEKNVLPLLARGPLPAAHRFALSACRGVEGPCPDGQQRAYRQDRSDRVGICQNGPASL